MVRTLTVILIFSLFYLQVLPVPSALCASAERLLVIHPIEQAGGPERIAQTGATHEIDPLLTKVRSEENRST